MEYAKITSKGQITIPKSVRDHLNLKPGDRIKFHKGTGGSHVYFVPTRTTVEDVFGFLGKIKKPERPVSLEEMDEASARHIREKFGK